MRYGLFLIKILVVLGTVITLLSCNRANTDSETIFEKEIDYIPINTDQQFLFDNIYQPRKMRVIGDLLLVSDFQNSPPFHVLETDSDGSLVYLRGEGIEGQGPGELELIEDFIETDLLIYVYDGGQLKLVPYNRDLSPSNNDDINLRAASRPINFHSLSSNKFIAGGVMRDGRFQIFDRTGELVGNYGNLLSLNEEVNPNHLASFWFSFITVNPIENWIYIFPLYADYIEKYNTEGELLKTIKGEEHPSPLVSFRQSDGESIPTADENKVSYLWVDSDENYIYALYSGVLREDLDELSANRVHKFDWDLNLVQAYELDHDTYMIAADGNGGIYTFISVDEGTEFKYQELE